MSISVQPRATILTHRSSDEHGAVSVKHDNLYAQWLSAVVDLEHEPTTRLLHTLSSFHTLTYLTFNLHYDYARGFCILANFLYSNRDLQLYSDKIDMSWQVCDQTSWVNIYWFEVLRVIDR